MAAILLVEDDPSMRAGLTLALGRNGHLMTSVATGEEALDHLRSRPPEIVILDVMLPGIDGFEVCRRIRKVDQVPIIMLTARSESLDIVVGLEAGADDYVIKPVEPAVLDARIRAALRRADGSMLNRSVYGDLVIDRAALRVTKAADEFTSPRPSCGCCSN